MQMSVLSLKSIFAHKILVQGPLVTEVIIDLTVKVTLALSSFRDQILPLKDTFLALLNGVQFIWFYQWGFDISKANFGCLFILCLTTEDSLAVKGRVSGPDQWRAICSAFLALTNGGIMCGINFGKLYILPVKRRVSGPDQWRASNSAFLALTNGALL